MQIPPLPNTLPKAVQVDTPAERIVRLDYIMTLIEMGIPVSRAASEGGVTYRTFKKWVNQDPAVMAQYQEAQLVIEEKIKEVAGLCALRAMEDPRYQTSMIFWLKTRCGWTETIPGGSQVMPSITFTTKDKE